MTRRPNSRPRPLSQLVYTRVQDDATRSPRVITLHGHKQFAAAVKDYGLAAAPEGRVIALESYKGVFVGREIVGYTWFVGPPAVPAPVFFGDALSEIERFLWDEVDRQECAQAELPFLIGVAQGAIMALGTAAAVPDLLSGVIAVDGFLPVVPGWAPPLAPLDGLPILLLDQPSDPHAAATVLSGDALVHTLTEWGGVVTRIERDLDAIPADEMRQWLAQQPPRFRAVDIAASAES